jgi:membrane protein CcdC involved in cytochrome C biogenesis
MILGMIWHFVFFKELYESLGIYNRVEPIIPLGFISMAIQGLIMAYLFPFFYREGNPVLHGIRFGLIMGFFLFSVSTLANAAKIEVTSMSSWIMIQTAFHLIQFLVAGILIGLVHRKQ